MTSRFPVVVLLLLVVSLAVVFGTPTGAVDADVPKAGPTAHGANGMVVSVSRPASEAGVAGLQKGGNAGDAAGAAGLPRAGKWPGGWAPRARGRLPCPPPR